MACDRELLVQVVTNLLTNARHALLGQPSRQITVETGTQDERAIIRITDTGCGIEPEDLPRIFTPFYSTKGVYAKAESPLADVPGLGLGLALSNTIVEAHGGELHVESEPGQGSSFTVLLPLA